MPWVDPATGETSDTCPLCVGTVEAAEAQMHAMELDLRKKRAEITRLRNEMEAAKVAKRDGAAWNEFLRCYKLAFPEKRLTATDVKSATATKFFLRLQSGASLEDVLNAIAGAMEYRYVVFGKRVRTGSKSDLAIHPQDILSVNNDALFDWLKDEGAHLREGRG